MKNLIRVARQGDFKEIEKWLKKEDTPEEGSFYVNINVIERAYEDAELFVLIQSSTKKAVGFILGGIHSIDILAVKKDLRTEGYGRTLFEYYRNKCWQDGSLGLVVHCEPKTSVPFWERMGFERIVNDAKIEMALVHEEPVIPTGIGTKKKVKVELFFDDKRGHYQQQEEIDAEDDGKQCMLLREYVKYVTTGNIIISITIDNDKKHCDKIKYSKNVGVEHRGSFIRLVNVNYGDFDDHYEIVEGQYPRTKA